MEWHKMAKMETGTLIVSLDLELYWGVRDCAKEDYRDAILGGRRAIPRILELFARYGIHATWATVGFLFFECRDELLRSLPQMLPSYNDRSLSPYSALQHIGESEVHDPLHYGLSLIKLIAQTPNQEIGSHSFSHYYCLDEGQTRETFEADLKSAIAIASKRGFRIRSFVFPRNQVKSEYLGILSKHGITSFRGHDSVFYERPRPSGQVPLLHRGVRILDSYLDISGHNGHVLTGRVGEPINIRSSRFLRPYSPHLISLEPLRLKRITDGMRHAAEKGLVYHLWWHPHNFGRHTEENLVMLEHILKCFRVYNNTLGMSSLSMGEMVDEAKLSTY